MTRDEVPSDLVDALEDVLETHGWGAMTVDLIAKAAGVNRVTLYRNGMSKERLLVAAAVAAALEFKEAALVPLTASGTARERLELLVEALFDSADGHLALLAGLYDGPTAIFHLLGTSTSDIDVITRFEYTEPFERLLRDGMIDGTLWSIDPVEDAELIFNAVGWTYVHMRRSHRWTPARARPAVRRIALASIVPVEGTR